MLTYALGRGLDYYDERTIERVQTSLAARDYKFSALVTQMVKSDPFLLRRRTGQKRKPPRKNEPARDFIPDRIITAS